MRVGRPALVATHYALVWGGWRAVAQPVCDGAPVSNITAELRPGSRVHGRPVALRSNRGLAYKGSVLLGAGFQVDRSEAEIWINSDSRCAEVLRPYLNASDLNSSPTATPTKWVIDFGDMPLSDAMSYVEPYRRVLETVKPERDTNSIKSRRENWWMHVGRAPELYSRISAEHRVIAMPGHSKYAVPRYIEIGPLFSSALVIFTQTSPGLYSVLVSSLHRAWTEAWGSRMKADIRYTPSDVAMTFPFPKWSAAMVENGQIIDRVVRAALTEMQLGITGLMNQFHDTDRDRKLEPLREIWRAVDRSVLDSYGWRDISPTYGFRPVGDSLVQWRWDSLSEKEVLQRLLQLNHQRAREEGQDVPEQGEMF